jgi:hypothetical protein
MLADVPWDAVAAIVGVAVLLGGALAGLVKWLVVGSRHKKMREAAQRLRLDTAMPMFKAKVYVPVEGATLHRAPISLSLDGQNTWVHEVRLSWFANPRDEYAEPQWAALDEACFPWTGPEPPFLLEAGGELGFGWSQARPMKPVSISWDLDVEWSVERRGPTRVTRVPPSDTAWQE